MKKIFTLLSLLVLTLTAMATTFTGHRIVTVGYLESSEMDNATITVTDKGNGKYDVVFNNIINKDGSYEDNYGTFTFSDLDGVTANGITTIEGKLLTGAVTSSGMGISSIGVTDVFVKMNDEKAYATMDGLITMFSRDTQLKVEFGEDDFPAASTDKVVGEDGYQPAGKAFDWDFDIDHYAEKFVAVVDLSTCAADAENENVASIGTDINAWFSNVANAGNIHIYYTPATKTLTCWYISSNASYGAWKYSKELTDIEGEINIDFSYQYGLRINGQQVFDAGQLIKLYNHNTLHFGSQEGSTRSNATYKSARVVKTAFEATDATEYTAPAKMLLDGKYSRFDAAQISLQATDYDVYTIILKDLSHNGKYLGSLKFTNIKGYLAEGSGDNSSSFIVINDTTANAVLKTAGELASSLGLTKGQEIRASIKDFYGQTSFLAGDFTMQDRKSVV